MSPIPVAGHDLEVSSSEECGHTAMQCHVVAGITTTTSSGAQPRNALAEAVTNKAL